MKNLFIIDEALEKESGHNFEYDKTVFQVFSDNGYKTTVVASDNVVPIIKEHLPILPLYNFGSLRKFRKIPFIGVIWSRILYMNTYRDIMKKIIRNLPEEPTLLFFTDVYAHNIYSIVKGLKGIDKHKAVLIFRTSITEPPQLPKFLQSIAKKLINKAQKKSVENSNIFFATDSEVIKDEWYQKFNQTISVLPIPHIHVINAGTKTPDSNYLNLVLPGPCRFEKGIETILSALEYLQENDTSFIRKIRFHVQLVTPKDPKDLDSIKARLSSLSCEKVFLHTLSTDDYYALLQQADIILLPYKSTDGYRARTSGIMSEAIGLAKPFITTDETWMAVQARKYNCGKIIDQESPVQLAAAIKDVFEHYDSELNKMSIAQKKWNQFHSKENFYAILSSIVS